jgi:hypothetical protein
MATGRSCRNAIFAPFRRRLLGSLLDVALLRLRVCLFAYDGIIANLTFLVNDISAVLSDR